MAIGPQSTAAFKKRGYIPLYLKKKKKKNFDYQKLILSNQKFLKKKLKFLKLILSNFKISILIKGENTLLVPTFWTDSQFGL